MSCSTPVFPVLHYLSELAQTHVHQVMMYMVPSNHLILCHPLLLLPSAFPSIRVFSNESILRIRWPKFWSFIFRISLSNEYSGLISFKVDWFGILVVQGTLKSILQHHSSKASILQHSAFYMVQLSHPYMIPRKTIALTIRTFVSKVISCFLICCLGLSVFHSFSSRCWLYSVNTNIKTQKTVKKKKTKLWFVDGRPQF